MSKGPGRIERAIEQAFRGNPDGYFSSCNLTAMIFGGDILLTKSQCHSVLRAADKVCRRLHWVKFHSFSRGSEAVYANGLSLRSYALGQARAHLGYDNPERVEARAEPDKYTLEIEHHTALAAGDDKKAAKIAAKIEKQRIAKLKALGISEEYWYAKPKASSDGPSR
jgi:hypothetical protein